MTHDPIDFLLVSRARDKVLLNDFAGLSAVKWDINDRVIIGAVLVDNGQPV